MGNELNCNLNLLHQSILLAVCYVPAFALIARAEAPDKGAGIPRPVPPRVLTLAEARQTALERNWDLLAAKSGIDAATAQLIVTKEYPNPLVSLSTVKIDAQGQGNATTLGNSFWNRSYDTIAAVSQLVEIDGKRGKRQASARAGIVGARARFYDARRLLDQGVTKAYVAALLAEENMRTLRESAQLLQREAGIAEIRFKAGDISDSDKKQIEINAARFELDARTAEVTAASARIAVEVLLGIEHPQGDWAPGNSLDELAVSSARASESKPGAFRPDLLAAEADLRRSQFDLKLQKALRIPDPTFLVQYERSPPGPPGPDTVGVGVSFPLPLWNRNGGAIKAAQAAQAQAALQVGKVQAQVVSDIATAELAYNDALERRQRYLTQIRPKSEQVRKTIAFAYEKGGASLVDLLTAERDDNEVRLATAQAMSDSAMAAADLVAAQTVFTEAELTPPK